MRSDAGKFQKIGREIKEYEMTITTQQLRDYTEIVKELDFLLRKKEQIKERLSVLKSPNYKEIKVKEGNRSKISEQENYVIKLEKINKKIDEYKTWLIPEHAKIKEEIARIKKWQYRNILVYRYLEKWKWSEIIQEFFEFEDDYEEEKDFKYRERIMYWHRKALTELSEGK